MLLSDVLFSSVSFFVRIWLYFSINLLATGFVSNIVMVCQDHFVICYVFPQFVWIPSFWDNLLRISEMLNTPSMLWGRSEANVLSRMFSRLSHTHSLPEV